MDLDHVVCHETVCFTVHGLSRFLTRGIYQTEHCSLICVKLVSQVVHPVFALYLKIFLMGPRDRFRSQALYVLVRVHIHWHPNRPSSGGLRYFLRLRTMNASRRSQTEKPMGIFGQHLSATTLLLESIPPLRVFYYPRLMLPPIGHGVHRGQVKGIHAGETVFVE